MKNNFAKLLDGLREEYLIKEDKARFLAEENKRLKDEHYKDDELQKLKEEKEELWKNLKFLYPMNSPDRKKILNWIEKHTKEVHKDKSPGYRMEIRYASIVDICTCVCEQCSNNAKKYALTKVNEDKKIDVSIYNNYYNDFMNEKDAEIDVYS